MRSAVAITRLPSKVTLRWWPQLMASRFDLFWAVLGYDTELRTKR